MSEVEDFSSVTKFLLQNKFPDIKKMSKAELLQEAMMWRNIWAWIPNEIKYYVARTGQQIGLTMRNYKRYLGVLLATYWDIKAVELGTYEKVYDQTTGESFFEKKVVKVNISNLVDVQWIQMRKTEKELLADDEQDQEEQAEVTEEGGE